MTNLSTIQSRDDLVEYISSLVDELETGNFEWENNTLASYLESLSAYLNDIDGFYSNVDIDVDPEICTWGLIADVLAGARVYE